MKSEKDVCPIDHSKFSAQKAEQPSCPEYVTQHWSVVNREGMQTFYRIPIVDENGETFRDPEKRFLTQTIDFSVIKISEKLRYLLELWFILKCSAFDEPKNFEIYLKYLESKRIQFSETLPVIETFDQYKAIAELGNHELFHENFGVNFSKIVFKIFFGKYLDTSSVLKTFEKLDSAEKVKIAIEKFLQLRELVRTSFHKLVVSIHNRRLDAEAVSESHDKSRRTLFQNYSGKRKNMLEAYSSLELKQIQFFWTRLSKDVASMSVLLNIKLSLDTWNTLGDDLLFEMKDDINNLGMHKEKIEKRSRMKASLSYAPTMRIKHPVVRNVGESRGQGVNFSSVVNKIRFNLDGEVHFLNIGSQVACPHIEAARRHRNIYDE